jgi:DNA polymerase-1
MKPTTADAYRLVHEGVLALSQIEVNGMRVDVGRLRSTMERVGKKIQSLEAELKGGSVFDKWRRRFGGKASLGSRPQLAKVLVEDLGFKPKTYTAKKKLPQMNQEALEMSDEPFVKKYLRLEKLKKLKSTYLAGVEREVVDGYLRPVFNQHLARTHRGSCDTPNFQNIPVRDKLVARLIRSCFIARPGHVLVEVDYSALEFRIAACFWRDDAMVEYASDPSLDIHRDMAAECYMTSADNVSKGMRFYAKNQFVFPTLYGSYYANTAKNLWKVVPELKLEDGNTPLWEWLERQGVGGMVDYEPIVEGVEDSFMRRFPQFASRRESWWDRYQRTGGFRMMTGFEIDGVLSRNFIYNCPVQGPAFHCLLWSLIRMQRWLRRTKMKSVIVGQIHDSLVADVHEDELNDYLVKAKQVMTVDLPKAWPWIITTLEIEAEVSPPGGSWFDKQEVEV